MSRLGNPSDLAPGTSSSEIHRRRSVALIGCGLLIVIALAVHRLVTTRNAERDALARGRLAQIALALGNYRQEYGRFPPAVVFDGNGTPMHSWRALISPYLDAKGDGKYDFGKSWNSQANATLRNTSVRCFRSRSDDEEARSSTNFVAVVGPGTTWDEDSTRGGRAVPTSIMVVELKDSGINWLEPRDVSIEEIRSGLLERFKMDHVNFVTSNGRVGTLYDNHIVFRGSEEDLLRSWLPAE